LINFFLSIIFFSSLNSIAVEDVKNSTISEIHFRAPESSKDIRFDYDTELLKLALEKTKLEYGEFNLKKTPPMNFARALNFVENNSLKNFIIKQSYSDKLLTKDVVYADFPVDLGVVGYRICFVTKEKEKSFENVKSLDELKKFSHGQGKGWLDVDILRNSNLEVTETVVYESLFKMVAKGRIDLFCRGANELFGEFDERKDLENLIYDKKILIYYPLPRFFISNKANKRLIERVEKGLVIAFKDGSLKKLWDKKYKSYIDRAKLKSRTKIYLENPFIKNNSLKYFKYIEQFD